MSLDSKLSFDEYLESVLSKIRKTIGLLRKFQSILSRMSLLKNYKSFARPQLDYGDILYDQTFNESFHERIRSIPYHGAIAIIGTSFKEDGSGNFDYFIKYIRMYHLLICTI